MVRLNRLVSWHLPPSLNTRIARAPIGFVDLPIVMLAKRLPYCDGQHFGNGLCRQIRRPWHSLLGQSYWSPFLREQPQVVYIIPARSSRLLHFINSDMANFAFLQQEFWLDFAKDWLWMIRFEIWIVYAYFIFTELCSFDSCQRLCLPFLRAMNTLTLRCLLSSLLW